MFKELTIEESPLRDGVVLAVTGEVDMASVNAFKQALAHAELGRSHEVWVDLSDVDFIDSSGLTTLVLAHRRMDNPVRRLGVICPAGPVRRVLEIAGIDRVMPVHASRHDARALT
jgi:anti-sigma B factor antagonist